MSMNDEGNATQASYDEAEIKRLRYKVHLLEQQLIQADARAQEAEQRRAHTAEARIRLEAQVSSLTNQLNALRPTIKKDIHGVPMNED